MDSSETDAMPQEPVESAPTQEEEITNDGQGTEDNTQVESTQVEETGTEQETQDKSQEVETIPKARFNEIYYQNKQREREIAELKAQQAQVQPTQQYAPSTKPTIDSCDYDDSRFQEALMDWKLEQRDQQMQAKQLQDVQNAKYQKFKTQQDQYSMNNIDYQNLTYQAQTAGIQFSDSIAEVIMDSDVGVKLHHHLLSNPSTLDKIQQMTPLQQMREIVKLENVFGNKTKAATKKQAAVISPVTGTSSAAGTKSLSESGKMSPDAYYKMRMAELNK